MSIKIYTDSKGFTLAEVVVVFALMVLMAAGALFQFTPLQESVALNNATRELVHDIRRVQNMAITVSETSGGVPLNRLGMYFDEENPNGYYIFIDVDENNRFNMGDQKIGFNLPGGVLDKTFDRGVRFQNLTPDEFYIIFRSPTAAISFHQGDDGTEGNPIVGVNNVSIILEPLSGSPARTITVRESGQVSVQ